MAKKKTKKVAAVGAIQAWQDDPMGLPQISRPVPNPSAPPLKFKIKGAAVPPGVYLPGTPQFVYWTAAEAMRRGGDFWASKGITKWQSSVGSTLPVGLDEGVDLNAYYDRSELAFFHDSVGGKTIYSAESPDVVCHELGHACLDAHCPALWNAHYIEVGSFHESFGDMSAILSALQLPSVRAAALAGVKGRKSSVLSRCAEQLGWAIGTKFGPTAVDPGCLRNAFNKFTYIDPNTLPNSAPATALCAEVHSFSRVFTGAFYDILSGMLKIVSASPTQAHLATVAGDCAALLMDATAAAPVKPNYYAQVAARMIDADTVRFNGKYHATLASTFVKRKILPAHIVSPAASVPKASRAAIAAVTLSPVARSETQQIVLNGKDFGIGTEDFIVEALVEHAPSMSVASAQSRSTETHADDVALATRRFVSMLAEHGRLGQIHVSSARGIAPGQGSTGKTTTHHIMKGKAGLHLQRVRFLCNCRHADRVPS